MKNNATLTTIDEQWAWDIFNALGIATKEGTGKSVVITAADCKNVPIGGGAEYYSDVNYVGTVTLV